MYKTLTLLSVRLGRHSCASAYHKSTVSLRRALLTPYPRHPYCWNCQTCWYHSTPPAVYGASRTDSLSGVAAQMLAGGADAYDGFIVSVDDLPTDPDEFESRLQHSLQVCSCTALGHSELFCLRHSTLVRGSDRTGSPQDWTTQGKHGIWITVPTAKSQLIPVAVKHGFEFHHAEKTHIMLTRWLPTSENTLPPNASHQVG